jgi:hypothetical protein
VSIVFLRDVNSEHGITAVRCLVSTENIPPSLPKDAKRNQVANRTPKFAQRSGTEPPGAAIRSGHVKLRCSGNRTHNLSVNRALTGHGKHMLSTE